MEWDARRDLVLDPALSWAARRALRRARRRWELIPGRPHGRRPRPPEFPWPYSPADGLFGFTILLAVALFWALPSVLFIVMDINGTAQPGEIIGSLIVIPVEAVLVYLVVSNGLDPLLWLLGILAMPFAALCWPLWRWRTRGSHQAVRHYGRYLVPSTDFTPEALRLWGQLRHASGRHPDHPGLPQRLWTIAGALARLEGLTEAQASALADDIGYQVEQLNQPRPAKPTDRRRPA
jgi:hypothetical protein